MMAAVPSTAALVAADIGSGIIVPIVVLAVVVPALFALFRRKLRSMGPGDAAPVSGSPLTSGALHRGAPSGWRFVYEVSGELGDVDQVAIGPGGIYALETVLTPMPELPSGSPDTSVPAGAIAVAAIARLKLDEVLQRCAMSSDALVRVHWARDDGGPACVELGHGSVAVCGHRLVEWLAALPPDRLSTAQVDLAWQTVTTGIGRPDPLT